MIANFVIAQENVWPVNDHSHTITCTHDHGVTAPRSEKKSGPENEFIPEKGERSPEAIGLNVLVLEGKASNDRIEILFPRERVEIKHGVSGYFYDVPHALESSKYEPRDMPYINSIYYMNYSESTQMVPEGRDDDDIMGFSDPNTGTGTNPLKTAVRNRIAELENEGIEIQLVINYLPFSGELSPTAGGATRDCDRNSKYFVSYINSAYSSENSASELAEITKGVAHEFGHNFELNHGSLDNISTCFENYASYDEALKANSLMAGTNSVKSVGNHKIHFNSYWSTSNASHLIDFFEEMEWLPTKVTTAIDDREISFELEVLPNPTYGPIRIAMTNQENILSILVVNSVGQTVINVSNINNAQHNLDIEHLDSGNYFLRIHMKDDIVTKHIIKQ